MEQEELTTGSWLSRVLSENGKKGGRRAWELGHAHRWTSEEAKAAVRARTEKRRQRQEETKRLANE